MKKFQTKAMAVLLVLFFCASFAQPQNFSIEYRGDTACGIIWGAPGAEISQVTGVELQFFGVLPVDLFQIDLKDSWLAKDNLQLEFQWKIDSEKDRTFLKVKRHDNSTISGCGEVLAVGGAGILILEDVFKKSSIEIHPVRIETKEVVVFPNPAHDFVRIRGDYEKVEIITTSGTLVRSISNYASMPISLEGIPKGVYCLQLLGKGICFQQKLIVE